MDAPRHEFAYRLRRALNWIPLGFAYALFYMGRYNLTVAKTALGDAMTKAEFGTIFGIGAWVYGLSFLLTGPLTDRLGGRRAMLIGTAGTILANALMGLTLLATAKWGWSLPIFGTFAVLFAVNMHFQSYGAIAIVTVKAPWFHLRERGTFSTIFGVMITLGLFFAFDWGYALVEATRAKHSTAPGFWTAVFTKLLGLGGTGVNENWWIFFLPAILLSATWVVMYLWLKDTPAQAGFANFDTGEESITKEGERLPVGRIFLKILTHPVLLVVCGIEFCSGILRNGIMHWYPIFAGEIGFKKTFWITSNWGLTMLIAGLGGAFLTGWASDRFFQSRRAPMATILYGVMIASAVLLTAMLGGNLWYAGAAAFAVSLAVIGVHGILSGTSTADFGGSRNAGTATGIVDGMVYLGTGLQAVVIGQLTPVGPAAKNPANWIWWPVFLIPFAVIGFILSARIWNALPKKAARKPEPAPAPKPVEVPSARE